MPDILSLQNTICNLQTDSSDSEQEERIIGESQSLKDKEIIEFIGNDINEKSI